jgi:hypothetical protein
LWPTASACADSLGYDLTEPLPDHSSLSRIRERYGLNVFRRFFEAIVEQCLAAGLVWGQELYIDATKVAANASGASRQPRLAVEAHLAHLFATEAADADDRGGGEAPDESAEGVQPARWPVALREDTQEDAAESTAPRRDGIGQAGRPDRTVISGTYRRTADFRASTTDLDATPMPGGDGRTRFRWKVRPRHITGDTTDGTGENIAALERERIRADVPLSQVGQRAGRFGDADFGYDAAADAYSCPGGQTLRFLSHCTSTERRISAAPAGVCRACALRDQCTTSLRGRRVGRHRDEAYLEQVRGYHATEPYAKAMRKRKVWVEPLFAEAKAWHGLRRFRFCGLENVNGEALRIAAGQNLKRLLSRRGWGRRPFPSGTAGILLPVLPPLPPLLTPTL